MKKLLVLGAIATAGITRIVRKNGGVQATKAKVSRKAGPVIRRVIAQANAKVTTLRAWRAARAAEHTSTGRKAATTAKVTQPLATAETRKAG